MTLDPFRWRDEFPILGRKTYLNSCSLGALSRRAQERVAQFHEDWHNYGASAWYETWVGRIDELRGRVAAMINATVEEVAMTHSTSAALSSLASALDYGKRNRVVVAELDFPTLVYQWLVKQGVEVVRVPSDDGATIDPQRFAEAIDERTVAVATGHVFYATGAIQDIRRVARLAHDAGALMIVDGYQALGQIPVDVQAEEVDIYMGGPLKWLLGGPGLCYLYVKRELITRLTPTVAGWWGARDQFAFDNTQFEFKDDARRFELGTPALHIVHSALGGQEIIDDVGIRAIRKRNAELTERLIGSVRAAGFRIRGASTPAARSAIVMVSHEDPRGVVRYLAERGIIVDHRPGHVRISPHFYNTEAEVDYVVDEIAAWRKA